MPKTMQIAVAALLAMTLGAAAQGGAFQYAISSGIVLLFVNAPD